MRSGSIKKKQFQIPIFQLYIVQRKTQIAIIKKYTKRRQHCTRVKRIKSHLITKNTKINLVNRTRKTRSFILIPDEI